MIVNWRRDVSLSATLSLCSLVRQNAAQQSDGRLGLFIVTEPHVTHPTAEAREALHVLLRRPLTSYMALVLLGDGAAAFRTLMAGYFMLARFAARVDVFDTVPMGARWVGKLGAPVVAPGDLQAAVATVQAHADPSLP